MPIRACNGQICSWNGLIGTNLCATFKDFDPVFPALKTSLHMCDVHLLLTDIGGLQKQGWNPHPVGHNVTLNMAGITPPRSFLFNKALSGFYFSALWPRISIVCVYLPKSRCSSLAGVLSCVNIPTASPLQHIMAENQLQTGNGSLVFMAARTPILQAHALCSGPSEEHYLRWCRKYNFSR